MTDDREAWPDIPEPPLTLRDLLFAVFLVAVIGVCTWLGLEMHDA